MDDQPLPDQPMRLIPVEIGDSFRASDGRVHWQALAQIDRSALTID